MRTTAFFFLARVSVSPRPRVLLFPLCLVPFVVCLLLSGCSLFDNTRLEQQRVEIERLRRESEQLRQEAEAIKQQRIKEEQEREACNRAFYAFDAARNATNPQDAIARYQEGLRLCPGDDVAHNELGELYLQVGRRADAIVQFEEALRLNPGFMRAQENLAAARQGPAP